VPGKFPRNSIWLNNILKKTGGIYLLIGAYIFYDMLRSTEGTVLTIIHFNKRRFLAIKSLGELQTLLQCMNLSINSCSEKKTVRSTIYIAPGI